MDRSSSSSSIDRITFSTPVADEKKQTDTSKVNGGKPNMVTKEEKQDTDSKRAIYGQSKTSAKTKATNNLPRFSKTSSSQNQKASTSTTATTSATTNATTTSSVRASSSPTGSDESTKEQIFHSTVPTLGSPSSSTTASLTSSISVANPEWEQFRQDAIDNKGCLVLRHWMKFDAACDWIANSPPQLTALSFNSDEFPDVDVNKLCKALKENTTLVKLYISGPVLHGVGVEAIVDAIKDNVLLTSLDLSGGSINDQGAKAIAKAIEGNSTLEVLGLLNNNIGDEGAKSLAEVIKNNKTLKKIELWRNNIRDEGAKYLSEALNINKNLTELGLYDNKVGAKGLTALAEAMKNNTAITKLECSKTFIDKLAINNLNLYPWERNDLIKTENKNGEVALNLIHEHTVKNSKLASEIGNAKKELGRINAELEKRNGNDDSLMYPSEIMDQVVDQMVEAGLKDEIIGLGESIKPKKT